MTDTTITPTTTPEPSHDGPVHDPRIASARAAWLKAGHSDLSFDVAFNQAAQKVTAEPSTSKMEVVDPLNNSPPLDADKTARMVARLRSAGVPDDRILAALEADGIAMQIDNRSQEQKDHDRAYGFDRPAYAAKDYRITHHHDVTLAKGPDHTAAFDQSAKDFLVATGLPPAIGNAFIERTVQVGQSYQAMSDAERSLFKIEQRQLGLRLSGSAEKLAETISLAGQAIKTAIGIGKGDFAAALAQSGAAHSFDILQTLANYQRHQNAYSENRPK